MMIHFQDTDKLTYQTLTYRFEVITMRYDFATDNQLKVILENDGTCPSYLLSETIEEVIRRDLYKNYLIRLLNNRFKAIRYVEYLTKLTFEEIKNLCYEQAFEAIRFYKPGKGGFLQFWTNFILTALSGVSKRYRAQMRTAEIVYLDEHPIQIVDDFNTERKAVNRVYIKELFSNLAKEEQEIILRYNNDYTFVEIAQHIGKSREYTRKKYYRAIEKLKEIGA